MIALVDWLIALNRTSCGPLAPMKLRPKLGFEKASMFVYAFAKGVRKGWLEPRYRALASRGFDGLVRELVKTDSAGRPSVRSLMLRSRSQRKLVQPSVWSMCW